MSIIKLYISCHKGSEIPKNNLFFPVQVGCAMKGKKRFSDTLHDDDGEDNISAKNHMYCELTAQYWAWKNDKADYYGFFHYRRFFSFSNKVYKTDNRSQIISPLICDETAHKYGLDDEKAMREIIEANDIVTGISFDITKVGTPKGLQNSVYKHWEAHDRDLIEINSVNVVLQLIKEKYPNVYEDATTYMKGKNFLGYNCFIMKKKLFDEFCSFEFDILKEFENRVDHSWYNDTLNRTCGFMGEIIYSIFIYHIKRTRKDLKIKELQLVYFEETSENFELMPAFDNENIPIVFSSDDYNSIYLLVALKSLIDNSSKDRNYDIIVLQYEIRDINKQRIISLFKGKNNFSIRFIDNKKQKSYISEISEIKRNDLYHLNKIFLPWILKNYDHVISLDSDLIIKADIGNIYDKADNTNDKIAYAVKDIFVQGSLNSGDKTLKILDKHEIKEKYNYFDTGVIIFDLEQIRKDTSLEKICSLIKDKKSKGKEEIFGSELINILYQGKIGYLNDCWNHKAPVNAEVEKTFAKAPSSEYKKYKEYSKNPSIIHYYLNPKPWGYFDYQYGNEFWKIAESIDEYELLLSRMAEIKAGNAMPPVSLHFLDIIFPKGTYRREIVKTLFPKDSKRFKFIKKVLGYYY